MAFLKKRIMCNLKNLNRFEREKQIVCHECGKEQSLAIDWDYQKCECGEYLYDYR